MSDIIPENTSKNDNLSVPTKGTHKFNNLYKGIIKKNGGGRILTDHHHLNKDTDIENKNNKIGLNQLTQNRENLSLDVVLNWVKSINRVDNLFLLKRYLDFLENQKIRNMLFLFLNFNFLYQKSFEKFLLLRANEVRNYIFILLENGIIEQVDDENIIKKQITIYSRLNGYGKNTFYQTIWYKLTLDAYKFYSIDLIKEYIFEHTPNSIKFIIESQGLKRLEYSRRVEREQQKQQQEKLNSSIEILKRHKNNKARFEQFLLVHSNLNNIDKEKLRELVFNE